MRTKLTLPATLSLTVLTACAPRDGGDAAAAPQDARADLADEATDVALADALDAAGDAATDDAAADAAFTDACIYNTAQERYGVSCRPRAGAPATAACPREVCQPTECPRASCQTCEYTFPCLADDGGAPCVEDGLCDPSLCPSGCHVA
ncbi:MAG: hypothetical protein U0324_03780 [Polyangiales bacterium]